MLTTYYREIDRYRPAEAEIAKYADLTKDEIIQRIEIQRIYVKAIESELELYALPPDAINTLYEAYVDWKRQRDDLRERLHEAEGELYSLGLGHIVEGTYI